MAPAFTASSGKILDWEAIAGLVYETGLRGDAAVTAVAITGSESGRDASLRVYNEATGDDSYGLWQINMLGGLGPDRRARYGLDTDGILLDPPTNARVMYGESKGGTDWSPWSSYNDGKHAPFMADARAAVATVEARGGNPSTNWGSKISTVGSTSSSSSPPVRSPDVVGDLPVGIDPARTTPPSADWESGFYIRGQVALLTVSAPLLTSGGSIDMGVDAVAELSLVLGLNPAVLYGVAEELSLEAAVDWWDLHFAVKGIDWDQGDDPSVYRYTARCRAAGPEEMRRREGNITRDWSNLSPTEVMQLLAAEHGLRFVGRGSNRRDLITRKGPETGAALVLDKTTDQTESDWDLGQRLAKEEGYWFFESAGTLYFAPPSWLVFTMPRFPIEVAGDLRGADDADQVNSGVLGIPHASQAADDDLTPGMPPRTIEIKLPRNRGEQVRPGMVADFTGLPLFDGTYLVSKVSYPLDGGLEPADITLVDPKDPVPEPPADTAGSSATDGTGTSTTPTSSTPTGTAGGSALDMVTVALRQVGKNYVYGAEAAPDDPDPKAFDCSELVQWACAQVGVTFVDGSYAQLDACERISVESASHIRGALLFPLPDAHHVAISLGDGEHTVEAMGRQYGVVQGNIANRFGTGGLIPGLDYDVDNRIDPRSRVPQ
jgi:cell wall-associated NlpC family hydrolase